MPELKETYIPSSEAAEILRLRPFGIQRLIRAGKIPAEKIANRWLVPRAAVEELAKTYVPKRGRPRTKAEHAERRQL